jgi:hypothetical protein
LQRRSHSGRVPIHSISNAFVDVPRTATILFDQIIGGGE